MKDQNELASQPRAERALEAGAADPQALERLYQRHQAMVLRTAYLILGSWEQAEDVAQEVWARLARSTGSYRAEQGTWSTWIHQITVNRCLTVRRRVRALVTRERPLPEGVELPSGRASPLEALLRQEEQRRVWAAVLGLPLKLRAAIVLRYYHDLSYEEIAQVLGCALGTVRSRLHAAHQKLRGTLGSQT
jgi:RNA polymerase sigma-70 factor (ECF subfamily)